MIIENYERLGMSIAWLSLLYEALLWPVAANVVTRPAFLRIGEYLVLISSVSMSHGNHVVYGNFCSEDN